MMIPLFLVLEVTQQADFIFCACYWPRSCADLAHIVEQLNPDVTTLEQIASRSAGL